MSSANTSDAGMVDVYASAMQHAINGELCSLRSTLKENPHLLSTVYLSRHHTARLGFLADLARSAAPGESVTAAAREFVRVCPPDFFVNAFISCYADRHGFYEARFDAAIMLLDHCPEDIWPHLAEAGLARWIVTTNMMINSHGLAFVSRSPDRQYDTAAVYTMAERVSKHVLIGRHLVLQCADGNDNALRATIKLLMMIEVWQKRIGHKAATEEIACLLKCMIARLLEHASGPAEMSQTSASAAANAALCLGFHNTVDFLEPFLLKHNPVKSMCGLRVCDCASWVGSMMVHQLRSLCWIQAKLPCAMTVCNDLGNNVYAEVAKKMYQNPSMVESDTSVQLLEQLFGRADPVHLARLNFNAMSPAELVILSFCRVSMLVHEQFKHIALDSVCCRVVRSGGIAKSFGLLAVQAARVGFLNLVKTGLLRAAVDVLRFSIRRKKRVSPGGIGVSPNVIRLHLQMFLNRSNAHLSGVDQFLFSCQQLSTIDLTTAGLLTHRLLPLPPTCFRIGYPYFTLRSNLTHTQHEAVRAVFCSFEAAKQRQGLPTVPPEIIFLVLTFVGRVDLGHYTGWFK